MLRRIEQLEDGQTNARPWRQPTFDGEGGSGPCTPALVMGGWSPDMEEQEVKDEAAKLFKNLSLDIELGEAFMPGKAERIPDSPHGCSGS